jgi:pyrroloquinoline quinone biosynthesis protein D
MLVVNASGAAILGLCDGEHSVASIVAALGTRYKHVVREEILTFLKRLASKRLVVFDVPQC